MHRCPFEHAEDIDLRRRRERTREQQLADRPLSAAELLLVADADLAACRTPEELAAVLDAYADRLSRMQKGRLVALVEARFGTAWARQAGLPVGRPELRITG